MKFYVRTKRIKKQRAAKKCKFLSKREKKKKHAHRKFSYFFFFLLLYSNTHSFRGRLSTWYPPGQVKNTRTRRDTGIEEYFSRITVCTLYPTGPLFSVTKKWNFLEFLINFVHDENHVRKHTPRHTNVSKWGHNIERSSDPILNYSHSIYNCPLGPMGIRKEEWNRLN